MGATESKPKVINQKLSLRYDDLNIKDIDIFFNSAFPAIREVEIIRCGFINRWNEFVRLSGGIVLKNTKFESCVQGMLWKLSADMNGNLSSIDISENEPFIMFKNTNFLKDEDIQISQSFQELCRFYFYNYDNVMRLEPQLYKLDVETRAYNKDQESLLNDRDVSLMEMSSYTRRLNDNSKKVCNAWEVIFEIRKCFADIRKGLIKYSKWTKEPETLKKFEDVGILARQKNISRPAKIVYKYSQEEKVAEYEDHFDLIQDDLKAEKEARSILDLTSRKITVISTSTKQPLKETILVTDMNEHKSTAESLTEVIPLKTEEIITTDVIKKKTINNGDNREYTTERREVIVKPSSSAIESDRRNYKSDIRDYTTDRREVIVQPSSSVIESVRRNYKSDNRDFSTDRKDVIIQPSSSVIESDSRNYKSDIRDYATDRREVIVQPSSLAIESDRRNYKSEIVTSNVLNPSMIIISDEKPMGSSYIIDKESFPGKGTIITQAESTRENYDRLRREADDLKRKNQELYHRLGEGEDNANANSIVQNNIGMQKTIIPTESYTDASKYPDYQKNHVPIKSWNFSLHKVVTADLTDYKKINRIEPIMDIGLIAAATQSGQLIFWKISDLENIKEEKVLNISPNTPIKSMLYLNDGNTLLCGSADGRISKINLNNLNNPIEKVCDLEHSIKSMVYTYNGHSILAASQNKIYEIDIVNNKVISFIDAHDDTVTDMAYNLQKEMFVTCSKDNNIKIWNSKTKECLGIMQGHSAPVISICFAYSKDHIYLVSIGKDSFITFWNLTNRNLTRTYELSDMPQKVLYLWDKKTVLAAHKNGVFTLWDLENEETKDFFDERLAYNNACYMNNGHNVVLTTADGNLEFWNAN